MLGSLLCIAIDALQKQNSRCHCSIVWGNNATHTMKRYRVNTFHHVNTFCCRWMLLMYTIRCKWSYIEGEVLAVSHLVVSVCVCTLFCDALQNNNSQTAASQSKWCHSWGLETEKLIQPSVQTVTMINKSWHSSSSFHHVLCLLLLTSLILFPVPGIPASNHLTWVVLVLMEPVLHFSPEEIQTLHTLIAWTDIIYCLFPTSNYRALREHKVNNYPKCT